jgi:hypothetical protein
MTSRREGCRPLFAEQRREVFYTEPGSAKSGEQGHLVEGGHTQKQHRSPGAHEHHGCGRFGSANEAGAAKRPDAVGPQNVAQADHEGPGTARTVPFDLLGGFLGRFLRIGRLWASRQSKMQTKAWGHSPSSARDAKQKGPGHRTLQFRITTII